MSELHVKARLILDKHDQLEGCSFINSDVVELLRALVAENERLMLQRDGARLGVSHWTEQYASAEAKLRAIYAHVPVAWSWTDSNGATWITVSDWCDRQGAQPLIPRPTMEETK